MNKKKWLKIWMLSMLHEEKEEGSKASWWMGNSYRDYARHLDHYHLIPFNFLFRLTERIRYGWDRFRLKPSWIDVELKKAFDMGSQKTAERI